MYRHVFVCRLFLLYWLVPIATWGLLISSLRGFAEHYPDGAFEYPRKTSIDLFRTRDVIPGWFDRLFITTRGSNYHLTHHLFPSVPFYRLARLQRELSSNPSYKKLALVTNGYGRVLVEILHAGVVSRDGVSLDLSRGLAPIDADQSEMAPKRQ